MHHKKVPALHRNRPFSKFAVGIIVTTLGLTGCVAPMPTAYTSAVVQRATSTYIHTYRVSAVDVSEKPLAGVTIALDLTAKGTANRKVNCVTDTAGQCPVVDYEVSRDPSFTYVNSFDSSARVVASKDGYYDGRGSTIAYSSSTASSSSSATGTIKVKMILPTDFLDDGFAESPADRDLRERVLRFLTAIRVQSVLNDSEVMLKGIGTSEFKGKKYLRLKINSTTSFNSLKLNKYDIGKRLFDETIRKVLNPLNDNIAAPKAYYGYDIVVYGHTKSFADEYATADKVEYRFLMPEAAVRRYKDKDISGQGLLDASVELMNDERVEYKLQ